VVAVVPARDEEATAGATVASLHALDAVEEVVVVADGAGDRTVAEAGRAGARVLVAPGALGKGRAVEEALDRIPPADVYLLVDGDVGDSASEAGALLEPVLDGRLDLAVGVLPPQPGGGFGLVKGLAGRAIRALSGFDPREPLSGQRAVRREALWACRPLAGGFGLETAMTVDAVRLGFRVGEVAVRMTHRPTGRGVRGFVHRARQGLDVLRAVVPRALGLR
jgi:glucosyl-3-phosphoglycerate synthase